MDSTVSRETESSQPIFSRIFRFKEGELLLVWSNRDCIGLEVESIHFESLAPICIEEFHSSIGIHLMNGERTHPSRFEFPWKDMKLGIIEHDFISLLKIFSS